jgi:N-carbamoyl-L-amino-acid hydrolase
LQSNWHPTRGIEVAFFTNEEGSRFSPDMLGSLVYVGGLSLDEALSQLDTDGLSVGGELERRALSGKADVPGIAPFAFVELHIEQGPVLDSSGLDVGIVTAVQGINWRRLHIKGVANHAGTAPMSMRTDAGFSAAQVIVKAREIGAKSAGKIVATVGFVSFKPNLVNVVPSSVEMTIDMRSQDDDCLAEAVAEMETFIANSLASEGCTYSLTEEVALEAHQFTGFVIDLLEESARELGLSFTKMVSGAGHDAQMLGRVSPAAMIFVPSIKGISHNPNERTESRDLVNGGNLLLSAVVKLSEL